MAAPTTNSSASTTTKGIVPAEWSAQAADAVVDTIAKVRDKTTRPAQVAARAVVYGLVAAVVGVIALVLTLVMIIRMANNWIPGLVWTVYAVLGALLLVAGLFCLGKANKPAARID